MCYARLSFFCLLFFWLCLPADAPRAEETGSWYLITETELRSIEEYRNKSEAEKQSWLLQARGLKAQAHSLSTQAESLRRESEALNNQLSAQREQNGKLQQSFNEYEAAQLTLLSSKNGEIAGMKLEVEKYKGKAALRLVIIIALLTVVAGYTAFRVCRFFRLI